MSRKALYSHRRLFFIKPFFTGCPPCPPCSELEWTLIRTSLFLALSSLSLILTTSERLFQWHSQANLFSVSPRFSETVNHQLAPRVLFLKHSDFTPRASSPTSCGRRMLRKKLNEVLLAAKQHNLIGRVLGSFLNGLLNSAHL